MAPPGTASWTARPLGQGATASPWRAAGQRALAGVAGISTSLQQSPGSQFKSESQTPPAALLSGSCLLARPLGRPLPRWLPSLAQRPDRSRGPRPAALLPALFPRGLVTAAPGRGGLGCSCPPGQPQAPPPARQGKVGSATHRGGKEARQKAWHGRRVPPSESVSEVVQTRLCKSEEVNLKTPDPVNGEL